MKNLCFSALVILAAGSFAITTLPSCADSANHMAKGNAKDDAAHAKAMELYERAVSLRKSWDEPGVERIKLVQQAIALYPNDPAFYCELAEEYRLLSDYPAVLDAAERAIKLDGRCALAWAEEGLALVQLKGADVGVIVLEKSVRLDPENPELWDTLAAYRTLTSSIGAAEEAYKTCLRLLHSPKPRAAFFFYGKTTAELDCLTGLGSLRLIEKRYSEAKQFYEEAKAADVNHTRSLVLDDQIERVDKRLQQESSAR